MAENEEREGIFIYRKLALFIVIFKFLGRGRLRCTWRSGHFWKVRCK